MSGVRVAIGDWSCSTEGEVDGDGVPWYLDDLVGWFDSPGVRAEPIPRPAADGSWDGEPTQDSRLITVQGTAQASSAAAARAARDRVIALLADETRYDTLIVDEQDRSLSRQATVRLADKTQTLDYGATAITFELYLFAPDPRRYSSTLHTATISRFTPGGGRSYDLSFDRSYGTSGSSGLVAVSNAGTVSTWPVLKFAGPLTNPLARLVGGSTVAATLSLASGQELDVDNGLRSVLLGSASRRQFLSDDGFFGLPPGSSQVYFAADDGDGTLTVEWRDAW